VRGGCGKGGRGGAKGKVGRKSKGGAIETEGGGWNKQGAEKNGVRGGGEGVGKGRRWW